MKRDLLRIIKRTTVIFLMTVIILSSSNMAKDYSVFSHRVKEHRKDCNSCHKIPTPNWASARKYPDVADYPGHASCVGCHSQQFFSGAIPAICTICHTNPSPRSSGGRFAFPLNKRKGEFETIFPHDVHQDIIALNNKQFTDRSIAVAHFVKASFTQIKGDDKKDNKPVFNNCTICHTTPETLPETKPRKLTKNLDMVAVAHQETFQPRAEFFKNMPQNHASCFNCHYQGQSPTKTECADCHRLTGAHFDTKIISRYSLKFNHESKNHREKDCTICHIRITQVSDIRVLTDADVPILTCATSSCHLENLEAEKAKRGESLAKKEPVFQCIYCHSSEIGSFQIPPSHEKLK